MHEEPTWVQMEEAAEALDKMKRAGEHGPKSEVYLRASQAYDDAVEAAARVIREKYDIADVIQSYIDSRVAALCDSKMVLEDIFREYDSFWNRMIYNEQWVLGAFSCYRNRLREMCLNIVNNPHGIKLAVALARQHIDAERERGVVTPVSHVALHENAVMKEFIGVLHVHGATVVHIGIMRGVVVVHGDEAFVYVGVMEGKWYGPDGCVVVGVGKAEKAGRGFPSVVEPARREGAQMTDTTLPICVPDQLLNCMPACVLVRQDDVEMVISAKKSRRSPTW